MRYGAIVPEDSRCVSPLTLQCGTPLMAIKPQTPA